MKRDFNSDDPDDEESNENPRFGLDIGAGVRTIADILRELDERGGVSGEGQHDGVGFGYSARTGLGPRPGTDDGSRTRKVRPSTGVEGVDAHVDTRRDGDELIVTADLPGVVREDLMVGFDEETTELVLGVDGRAIERVPVPWGAVEVADASFNNGVLVARLREDTR